MAEGKPPWSEPLGHFEGEVHDDMGQWEKSERMRSTYTVLISRRSQEAIRSTTRGRVSYSGLKIDAYSL